MSASIGDAGFFRARVSHTSRRRVHVEAQPLAILPLHATLTACPQREVRCFGSPYENDHYPIQKKYIRTLDYIFLVIYLLVGVAFYVRHRTKISYTVTDPACYLFICLASHRNIWCLRHNRREKFDDTCGPDFSPRRGSWPPMRRRILRVPGSCAEFGNDPRGDRPKGIPPRGLSFQSGGIQASLAEAELC